MASMVTNCPGSTSRHDENTPIEERLATALSRGLPLMRKADQQPTFIPPANLPEDLNMTQATEQFGAYEGIDFDFENLEITEDQSIFDYHENLSKNPPIPWDNSLKDPPVATSTPQTNPIIPSTASGVTTHQATSHHSANEQIATHTSMPLVSSLQPPIPHPRIRELRPGLSHYPGQHTTTLLPNSGPSPYSSPFSTSSPYSTLNPSPDSRLNPFYYSPLNPFHDSTISPSRPKRHATNNPYSPRISTGLGMADPSAPVPNFTPSPPSISELQPGLAHRFKKPHSQVPAHLPTSVPSPNPTLNASLPKRRRTSPLQPLQPQSSIPAVSTAYCNVPSDGKLPNCSGFPANTSASADNICSCYGHSSAPR